MGQPAVLTVTVDTDFCCTVADRFDHAPAFALDDDLAARYERMKRENVAHYEAMVGAGIAVEPWLGAGQPYRSSAELVRSVRETGVIRIFLTRNGHGPGAASGLHPLREPSGVAVQGVELTHNDLLRATHDVFGHVVSGNTFGPSGELEAAYCHMSLFSEQARTVLFTEHVAQTCWFYFGAHLRDAAGRVRRAGDPGYVPPHRRPYPEQKVFAYEPSYLDAFRSMFRLEAAA